MKKIITLFVVTTLTMPFMVSAVSANNNDTTQIIDSVVMNMPSYTTTLLNPTKELVIAQMNYCTNALSNIVHNKSNAVLAYESDQLINNLTMEQACGIEEIKEYRTALLDAISKFQITAEERQLMNRIQSIKKDNLKWQALSNALNPTMLVTGGGKVGIQLAFQATLAAARTAVEYKTASNELEIEALQAMWELRKQDLDGIRECRNKSMKLIFDLFQSHGLQEYNRLTEETAQNLLKYISEPNPQRRIRVLKENQKYYSKYAPYYYYLGMAYVDNNEYNKAKPILQKYLDMYNSTPIFRHDNMSGCIALTTLTYEKNLTKEKKIELINTARHNLPHNSAAHLQCALVYIYDLMEEVKGLEIIQSAIDDPYASDREILYLAIANLATMLNKYPLLQSQIENCMAEEPIIHLDTYLLYCINKQSNAWEDINEILHFEDVASRKIETAFIRKDFNKDLSINIPKHFVMNDGACRVVLGQYIKDNFITKQFVLYNDNYITLEEIEKVDCFKRIKELKYLYLEEISKENQIYVLRDGNVASIENGTWHRQDEYKTNAKISDADIKDIASFYKKHLPKTTEYTTWKFNERSNMNATANVALTYFFPIVRVGVELVETSLQEGLYLNFNFNNNIQIVYRYNNDKQDLTACFYQYDNTCVFSSDSIKIEMTENVNHNADILSCDSNRTMWETVKSMFKKDTMVIDTTLKIEEMQVEEELEVTENDSTTSFFTNFKNRVKKLW